MFKFMFLGTTLLITLQVIWVMSEKTNDVCVVPRVNCGNRYREITINYTVQAPNTTTLQTKVTLEDGCSFFYAMMDAANKDKRFQFSGDYWGGDLNGFFITKINNISQIPAQHYYWMFYINSTASSCGVSSTSVKANTNYLFKLELHK